MSIRNLESEMPLLSEQSPTPMGYLTQKMDKSTVLLTVAKVMTAAGQVTIGIVATTQSVEDSTIFGWSAMSLAATAVCLPTLRFFCLNEEMRNASTLCGYLISPLIAQSVPFGTGLLAGLNYLPAYTAALSSTVTGIVQGFAICYSHWRTYSQQKQSFTDRDMITNMEQYEEAENLGP